MNSGYDVYYESNKHIRGTARWFRNENHAMAFRDLCQLLGINVSRIFPH